MSPMIRFGAWRLALALVVGAAASCFADPPSVECPDGANGCGCAAGSACDAGLVCNPDDNCVDPACVDGSAMCPCYPNGTCDGTLVCQQSLCTQGSGATGMVADGGTRGEAEAGGTTTVAADEGTESTRDTGIADGMTTDPGPETDDAADGGPSCVDTCTDGEACLSNGTCGPSPYVGCAAGNCDDGAACEDLGSGVNICAPPCDETLPNECPVPTGAARVNCTTRSGCRVPCTLADDCEWLPGGVCSNNYCGVQG